MARPAIVEKPGVAPLDPEYVQGGRPDEIWAHFRSGAVVQATRDRSRHYPGLSGAAPSTLSLYLRADGLRLKASHVIDAGCGSGEGLRHLSHAFRRVTGVDKDVKALAFARQLAPEARAVSADLMLGSLRTEPAQLAYLVDVLGHIDRPHRALAQLSKRLEGACGIFVAEPAVVAAQCLVPPARRAFSMRNLHSVLIRGGFLVEQWLGYDPTFLAAYATGIRDSATTDLLEAETHWERGALELAESSAKRACRSSVPALRLEALLALARIQMDLSRRDIATATLMEARELDPGDARPPAALARLAELAGAESRAIALAREAVRLDPTELAAVTAMGALARDDPQAALEAWIAAHALAPDHPDIAARLCEAALRVGDCALAVTVLERLGRYAPQRESASRSIAMAWLLAHEGHSLQAELEARLAETLEPDSVQLKELRVFLQSLPPG